MKSLRFVESPDGNSLKVKTEGDAVRLCENWSVLTRENESPIEFLMGCELFHRCAVVSQRIPHVMPTWTEWQPKVGFSIQPQFKIGKYRADFAVSLMVSGVTKGGVFKPSELPKPFYAQVLVECDGFEFHDRFAWQAARDNKRDRELLIAGWPTLRFAGLEITRDAAACADQVVSILSCAIDEQKRASGRRKGRESAS